MVKAITEARWQIAQQHEAAFWAREAQNPDKLARDVAEGHHFTAGVLDIRHETVFAATVLDIAGGPHPLGPKPGWYLSEYTVIDPGHYQYEYGIDHVPLCAEDYTGLGASEVWGYNVLQHVRDPAAVMATARRCALRTIRWFDVVDSAIYPVHPHSISAEWLRVHMSRDGFRITRDIDGSRLVEGARQKFVALVAERT